MKTQCNDLDWSKSFMYAIHQTYFLVEKRLEHKLHDAKGITFSQFLILLGLHCKSNTSQSGIAQFLYLTEATVSRHITALEKEKLLTRKEDPDNRRKHILTMTTKGTAAFASAHAIIERELKEVFSSVPEKDRSLIMDVFHGVIKNLKFKA
jgi:MarR family transcriptional regulator for hemolysin